MKIEGRKSPSTANTSMILPFKSVTTEPAGLSNRLLAFGKVD